MIYNPKQSQPDSVMQEFNYKVILVYISDHDSKMCVGSRNDFRDRCGKFWCEKYTPISLSCNVCSGGSLTNLTNAAGSSMVTRRQIFSS